MRSVSVIGAGLSKFGERWETSFRELIYEASLNAMEDARIEGKDIQALYGGSMAPGRLIGQEHIGALIADQLGLNPIPSVRVEAACASGGVALRQAYHAIASDAYDIVAVGGVEKMTEVSTEEVATALGGAGDQEWELFLGATFPAIYALMARRHMLEYGTTEEQMALCSVKNHANAVHNPYAQYRKAISVEQVMESGYIAEPLKLLDCSPITDGAAALILCASDMAKKYSDTPIHIAASAQASDTLALDDRRTLSALEATRYAAKEAFKQAKMTPKDIPLAEVHDCFSIAEIMAIEDLGFFKKGKGGKAVQDGETQLNSRLSINTSGGLKACGHPVGATGIKQAVEITWQLRQQAGKRQVANAEVGLAHNVGGSGATAVVHIFKRGD
ncbi:thiolase domain-containing protein [Candidatus Micrarchaeota archaeon]|nr:thiolase domain-containing protein [Candidatus Micrarchaeota archaeon]